MIKQNNNQMISAGIIGMGSYLPPRIVTNKELETMIDTSDEWITTKTGIKERRFVPPDWALSDVCIRAAKKAIKNAGLKPDDIEVIIVGAMSHDYIGGILTSNIIKEKIGARNAFGMDLSIICPGALYCTEIAANFIRTGRYKYILVINGEVFSKYQHSRLTGVIFGDGAGAVVMGPVKKGFGLIDSYIRSELKNADKLAVMGGGSKYLFNEENMKNGLFKIQMDGPIIYKFAIDSFDDAVNKILERTGLSLNEVDIIIPHQANINIIKEAMNKLNLPLSKTYINVQKYGNIGGGSVNVALDEAQRKGLIKKGDIVMCVAFGAGLAWGANIMKWCY
jgi:3-oxoacyl-[acyl-carrier-protein] synthase-3